jgi:ATP-dependent protease HslVU (ClpYQ) peptidase subunit
VPSGPDEQASQGTEIGPNALTNAAEIMQASKKRGKSVIEQNSQDMAIEEPFRRANNGESRIASQATGLERVQHLGIGTSADATTRISQLDERLMVHDGEIAKGSEDVVEEASDKQADDIL